MLSISIIIMMMMIKCPYKMYTLINDYSYTTHITVSAARVTRCCDPSFFGLGGHVVMKSLVDVHILVLKNQ